MVEDLGRDMVVHQHLNLHLVFLPNDSVDKFFYDLQSVLLTIPLASDSLYENHTVSELCSAQRYHFQRRMTEKLILQHIITALIEIGY